MVCGQFGEAEASLQLSVETAHAISGSFTEAQDYLTLGRCHLLQRNYTRAVEVFETSGRVAESANDKRGQASAELFLAETYFESGNVTIARQILTRAGAT